MIRHLAFDFVSCSADDRSTQQDNPATLVRRRPFAVASVKPSAPPTGGPMFLDYGPGPRLGLKLEPRKEKVEVLVIDRVEKATPD
jgi:hypothetical protein